MQVAIINDRIDKATGTGVWWSARTSLAIALGAKNKAAPYVSSNVTTSMTGLVDKVDYALPVTHIKVVVNRRSAVTITVVETQKGTLSLDIKRALRV